MIFHSEKSYKTCVIFACVISKNVIYFDHKITKLEKRLTPFRHISSILSLSLSGLSTPITPTISRKPSVLTGTRFSSFYRRTDAPADTFFAAARCRKSGRNRFCIALPCCTNVGNLSCPFRLPRFWSELTSTRRGGYCPPVFLELCRQLPVGSA